MGSHTDEVIEELAARAAIEDALHTYCRGIDRLDPDAVAAAFHPDGVLVDYGSGDPVPAAQFAGYACKKLGQAYTATQHRVTNIKVERDADTALVESYVLAYHVEDDDDGHALHTFAGRYIDTFTRRDDRWRIARRVLRVDWTRRDPWEGSMRGSYVPSGRDRTDPVYTERPTPPGDVNA